MPTEGAMYISSGKACRSHLEISDVLGHVALGVDLDDKVKVALGILRRCRCVRPDDKFAGAIVLLRAYGSPMQPSGSMQVLLDGTI